MGVHKLWDILLTVAVQKRIEDLSGLVLAIDASIWVVKINSIYENVDEGLKCIFNKLVWLKKNNIKPIFVFDGDTPLLKRRTLQERRNRRKQLNNFDITKKVQIEIVKTITGAQSTQKSQQTAALQEKSKQIDLMLANLFKYENAATTIELSEKMALQAEVLNKKYELYCEMQPNLCDFANLDIETKEQILEQIKESGVSSKDFRKIKDQMSEQEKIMYEMEVTKKKSQIRELQDNLYRKLMTKKIENGYQIIEGVYNGKKVVQKRKIKQNSFNDWGLVGTKKETCNDFKQIFRKSRDIQDSQKSAQEDDQKNNFFAKIFTKDYNEDKRKSQGSLSQISSRLSQLASNSRSHKQKEYRSNQPKFRNKIVDYSEDEHLYEVEQRGEVRDRQKISEDPDNFPDFIMMQNLDELCTSNHNLHLQNMLDILGINYIVAPFEAEAQCAALQQMGLVDGVVTEDSDVFLFGARTVYRGLFQDNVKAYSMRKVEQKLLLTREKLILFGLMLGSDYTDGVKGIGIVNAMEILKVHHDIESLRNFTEWAKNADILQQKDQHKTEYMLQSAMSEDEIQFYKLHRKFKNYWHIHPSFPQQDIYQAYLNPAIQVGAQLEKKVTDTKKLELQPLKKLMEQKFKMVSMQIEMNIKIFGKQFERKKQREITDYMGGDLARIASKRLQKAINFRHLSS